MKAIEDNSFEAAFIAALQFQAQGIRWKDIGWRTLHVWIYGGE